MNIFKLIIKSFTVVILISNSQAFAKTMQPNIVLMVADDHGTEALGVYGNKVIRTPHLDALAEDGIKFNHAYGTSASCSASRSVILTGLQNHANGQYGHVHDYHHFNTFDSIVSLPVRLSNAGYRTAQVGKFHIGPNAVYKFDQYFNVTENNANGERNSVGMATAAIPLFKEKSEKPFFLYLATNDPHRDHRTNILGDNTFGNSLDNQMLGLSRLDYSAEDTIVPPYLPDIPETRRELAEYYQSVTRVDDTMGELVHQLKSAGHYDNTIIIYLSDNGTAMPGAKTTVYDPGIRLPLIVKNAKNTNSITSGEIAKNCSTDAMISWTDITPTILDLAGIETEKNEFHGRSFSSVLTAPNKIEGWDEIYASHTFHEITMYYPMRVIRTKDFKLIWNLANELTYPFASDLFVSSTWQGTLKRDLSHFGAITTKAYLHRPKYELYDMRVEPSIRESVNLADEVEYQQIKQLLLEKLHLFQEQTSDPWIYKKDYE